MTWLVSQEMGYREGRFCLAWQVSLLLALSQPGYGLSG
jgi:hypothetical protein